MSLREQGYWDTHYKDELECYEDDGDEGEVWFGVGLKRKIADWIMERFNITKDNRILDIGCGNSFIIHTLADKYFQKTRSDEKNLEKFKITGIDYSNYSIELSKKILTDRGFNDKIELKQIELKQCDFLDLNQINSITPSEKFDFIIDVGTYDAICLLALNDNDCSLEETKSRYLRSLYSIVKLGTIFILASCNHTEEELLDLLKLNCFADWKIIDRIETPRIKFGGKEGSQVTCLIIEFLGVNSNKV